MRWCQAFFTLHRQRQHGKLFGCSALSRKFTVIAGVFSQAFAPPTPRKTSRIKRLRQLRQDNHSPDRYHHLRTGEWRKLKVRRTRPAPVGEYAWRGFDTRGFGTQPGPPFWPAHIGQAIRLQRSTGSDRLLDRNCVHFLKVFPGWVSGSRSASTSDHQTSDNCFRWRAALMLPKYFPARSVLSRSKAPWDGLLGKSTCRKTWIFPLDRLF